MRLVWQVTSSLRGLVSGSGRDAIPWCCGPYLVHCYFRYWYGPKSFSQILIVYALMSMFFYGSAAVKFAYLAEVFPTRIRALAMACCGSLAVTLGSAAGPYSVSLAIEVWGWHIGYAVLVGVPLALAGLLYLNLDALPSGLEVEEIERRVGNGEVLNG